MVLRCPKCGGKRVVFLSTTDGTAVGSTDQRYWCKDCDYRGSLILDDTVAKEDKAVLDDLERIKKDAGKTAPEMLPPGVSDILLYALLFVIIWGFISMGCSLAAGGEIYVSSGIAALITLAIMVVLHLYRRG